MVVLTFLRLPPLQFSEFQIILFLFISFLFSFLFTFLLPLPIWLPSPSFTSTLDSHLSSPSLFPYLRFSQSKILSFLLITFLPFLLSFILTSLTRLPSLPLKIPFFPHFLFLSFPLLPFLIPKHSLPPSFHFSLRLLLYSVTPLNTPVPLLVSVAPLVPSSVPLISTTLP